MALVLADRVQQTGTANTTVSFTLSGSVTGFQSFTAGVGNGNTTYYSAFDASGNWETGLGTYSTTGPTLTRTTIYTSSNANAAVTFVGTVTVFVTYVATQAVYEDASGNVTGYPISGGSINNTPIGATTASTGTFTTLSCTSFADTGSLARNGGKTANTTITNTTTYTTGGTTLLTQTAAVGSTWRIRAFGQYTAVSSGTARTARVACFWGSTQLTAITPTVLTSTAQTTQWQCEFTLTASSTTAIWTAGTMISRVASATALAMDNATAASTAVTAGAQTLDLRFSMSNATPADSWIIQSVTMERLE
jgi:hypothetical protein